MRVQPIKEFVDDTFWYLTSTYDIDDLEYFASKIKSKIEDYIENYDEIREEIAYGDYIDGLIEEQRIRENEGNDR